MCADRGIPLLGTKGASVHVRAITGALARRGHDVHMLCARIGEGNPAPHVASVQHCDSPEHLDTALRTLMADHALDVVLERYSLESGTARRTSRVLAIPLVLEVNAPLVLEAARWRGLTDPERHLVAEREKFRSADAVIAVSSTLVEYVERQAPGALVRRVPNGAEIEPFARARAERVGVDRGDVVIGFAGSMKPWHGVDDLLDAFARLREMRLPAQLVLAGHGPKETALRERVAATVGLRGSVEFLGSVPHEDMPGVLARFDIGAAPYQQSPDFYFSPLKVVEYLASGLPVVYPRIGDLPELVAGAGIAYEPGDSDALSGALAALVQDSGLRARLSVAAVARAPELSWETTARTVEDLLARVAAAGTRTSS